MKITIQHFDIRSTHVVDSLIEERILALQPWLQIDEANVRLEHQRESSPPFRVSVHLVAPGPDVLAESRGHTIRAAIDKVIGDLQTRIRERTLRRKMRLKSKLNEPRPLPA